MKWTICLAFLFVGFLTFPSIAHGDPVGEITHMEGRVDITSPGQAARPAHLGDELYVGDIIRAKSRSKAEVALVDQSVLRLAQNTRVEISEYMVSGDRHVGRLRLFRGKIQSIVKKAIQKVLGRAIRRRFEVHTSTAVCGVRGTNFITYYQRGISGAVFIEGQGYGYSLERPDVMRDISAGQAMVVLDPAQPPIVRPAAAVEVVQHLDDTTPTEPQEEDSEGSEGLEEPGSEPEPSAEGDESSENLASEPEPDSDEGESTETLTADAEPGSDTGEPTDDFSSDSDPVGDDSATSTEEIAMTEGEVLLAEERTPLEGGVEEILTMESEISMLTGTDPLSEPLVPFTDVLAENPPYFEGHFDGVFGFAASDEGSIFGSVSCPESIWGGSGVFNASGTYRNPMGTSIWHGEWGGGFTQSPDVGAFGGFMGGTKRGTLLDARAVALFVRPDGSAGIVRSGLIQGGFDPSMHHWDASGHLETVSLGTTSVLPSEIPLHSPYIVMDPSHGMVAGDLTGDFDHELVHFSDNPEWGVWWGVGSGDHLAALPEDWHSWTVSDPADDSFMLNTEINGHLLPERGLVGDVLGHYADFEEAATGIVVGELRGTFDPTALGWEAVQTGVFLQTSKFLAMSRTQTGRQKLEKLDIPSIEVGRANLSGNNGNLLVNMDNVTYFAYANGAPPKIWATEDVHGAFVNLPNSSDMVLLSGSGLSAKFTVKKWHSGHWMAKIHNGQGTYAGPGSMNGRFINFYGGAAGKYKFSNKIFWGTGSGVTK